MHVAIAQRRLDEYASLSAHDELEPTLIVEAAAEIGTALDQVESSGVAESQASVEQVTALAETQLQTLSDRVAELSVDQQQEFHSARTMFAANQARMAALMKAHPVASPPGQGTPGKPSPTATATASLVPPTSTATATVQPTVTPTETELPEVTATPSDPKITPPGLVNTPKPKITPPGLENTPKPKTTPPGLVKTPPKPKRK